MNTKKYNYHKEGNFNVRVCIKDGSKQYSHKLSKKSGFGSLDKFCRDATIAELQRLLDTHNKGMMDKYRLINEAYNTGVITKDEYIYKKREQKCIPEVVRDWMNLKKQQLKANPTIESIIDDAKYTMRKQRHIDSVLFEDTYRIANGFLDDYVLSIDNEDYLFLGIVNVVYNKYNIHFDLEQEMHDYDLDEDTYIAIFNEIDAWADNNYWI